MKNGTVYAEFVYFALIHKNNQHVHHLIVCSKKKKKKKIRPTYPISKKSVTGNIQLFFLGLKLFPRQLKAYVIGLRPLEIVLLFQCGIDFSLSPHCKG